VIVVIIYVNEQHCQIAGNSCKAICTALKPKGLFSGTPGKLGGYGKNQIDRDYPQPSPNTNIGDGCSSETQWQWADLYDRLKIESVPMETWLLRGIYRGSHPFYRGELIRFIFLDKWNKRLLTPIKFRNQIHFQIKIYSIKYIF
jgi:hypothetical protein